MMEEIIDWKRVLAIDARFLEIFKVRFVKFLDTALVIAGCGIHLDVVKFDRYLERKYENYREGMSMEEFITMKFGLGAANFVEELI